MFASSMTGQATAAPGVLEQNMSGGFRQGKLVLKFETHVADRSEMNSAKKQGGSPMARNPLIETVLDQLAAGVPMAEVKRRYNLTQRDIVKAAMYGVAELREEYMALLARKHLKPR